VKAVKMLVSKKLRACVVLSRMNLVAIEVPAAGVALTGEELEFIDAAFAEPSAEALDENIGCP